MIPRLLGTRAQQMATWFPVVSVMGPRQSGKSTLLRHTFPSYEYLNLETRNLRIAAQRDPVGFINSRPSHLSSMKHNMHPTYSPKSKPPPTRDTRWVNICFQGRRISYCSSMSMNLWLVESVLCSCSL